MRRIETFVHVVWSTWRRLPLIDDSTEGPLHAAISLKCTQLGCTVVAVGGTFDHVHLLVQLHPSVSLAQLVGQVKGFSSFVMTHELAPGRFFRWQERYGAVTVAPDDFSVVASYVRKQRQHHQAKQVLSDLELPSS